MMRLVRSCGTSGVSLLVFWLAGCSSEPKPTGDLNVLQGRWEQVEADPGFKSDWFEVRGARVTRRGSWDPVGGESKFHYRIEVDEGSDPKQVRLVDQGRTVQVSAYEVDGDTLSLTSMNRDQTKPLPANWKGLPNAKPGIISQMSSTIVTVTYKYRRVAGR